MSKINRGRVKTGLLVIFSALSVLFLLLNQKSVDSAGVDLNITTNTSWASGTYNYGNLTISNNAILTLQSSGANGVIINATSVTVDLGASISADGQGYAGGAAGASGTGTGAGVGSATGGGGGGGYGGAGASGTSGGAGGTTYGSSTAPSNIGSGGGGGAAAAGGAGGGAIKLAVSGTVTVNGGISANGTAGSAAAGSGGGGSGGSIQINCAALAGSGAITANGGNGGATASAGGGGGGGRIAIYSSTSTFSGSPSVTKGTNGTGGADGTLTNSTRLPAMKTGTYVGTGASLSITGLGFQPDLVIIKAATTAGAAVFTTSAMAADSTAYLGVASANFSGGIASLDSDGFTVGTDASVNYAVTATAYQWIAFGGSGNGCFKVGTYTGNGISRDITGIGFQPDLAWVKSSGANLGIWKTKDVSSTNSLYFSGTAQAANRITGFVSDGFSLGTDAEVNTDTVAYYYVAFKEASGSMKVGTYTGDGTDNKNISGVGFNPGFVLIKNTTTNLGAFSCRSIIGDYSPLFTAAANVSDVIQSLDTPAGDGFQVGTNAYVNAVSSTYYYAAFSGPPAAAAAGNFTMAKGSYSGNGTTQSISSLGFRPELVIIKSISTDYAVFRSSAMYGDRSAYLANSSTGDLSGGVTSLDSDGFTVGSDSTVNTNGGTYYWEAFDIPSTGAVDFQVGSYLGSSTDNRSITGVGFKPNLVVIKASNGNIGVWKTSSHSGERCSFFDATSEEAGNIKALETDGFKVGASSYVNSVGVAYWWFAFKAGNNFSVGSYSANNTDNTNITGVGFQPDLVWIKSKAGNQGVHRSSSFTDTNSQYFSNVANATTNLKNIISDGFTVGNSTAVNNPSSTVYRYAAWRVYSADVTNPAVSSFSPADGATSAGVGVNLIINFAEPVDINTGNIVIKKSSDNSTVETIAVTSSQVTGSGTKTININPTSDFNYNTGYYVQIAGTCFKDTAGLAYAGISDTTTWNFTTLNTTAGVPTLKTGTYIGTGASLAITGVGFQPDLVMVKSASSTAGLVFRSSAMTGDTTAYLGVASADFSGGITSLDSGGFTLGTNTAVNNAGTAYQWIAFSGSGNGYFKVGTYSGTGAGHDITGVGFQPDLVWVKSSGLNLGVWRTADVSGSNSLYFNGQSQGADQITAFVSDGFTVGTDAQVNAGSTNYWYAAFKQAAGSIKVGSYTGDSTDDRNISGVGFKPGFVFVKDTVTDSAMFSCSSLKGDSSGYFTAVGNGVNAIQSLEQPAGDGFQVGTGGNVNTVNYTYYYAAFAEQAAAAATGSFNLAKGSYSGTGSAQSISGLGFQPELVIIKSITTDYAVFRSSAMYGDRSAYLSTGTADLSGAVTSLDSDGFTVGTHATVNTSAGTYYWEAFDIPSTGAVDFQVGSYAGNALDNRSITGLGFQPDLVVIKASTANGGVWRTSNHTGDSSSLFGSVAETSNIIQALEPDGFQIGYGGYVNTDQAIYWWFAFKADDNFSVGSYTADAQASKDITGVGFQPDLVWVKGNNTVNAVQRSDSLAADNCQYFANTANITGGTGIKDSISDGFSVGSGTSVNSPSNTIYRYAAWKTKDHITIRNAASGGGSEVTTASLVANQDTLTLYAAEYDNTNTYVADQSVTWGVTGTLNSAWLSAASGASTILQPGVNNTGSGTVTATHATLTGDATGTISIGASTATQLGFTQQPSATATAGTAFGTQPIVAVQDAYGNTVTSDNATSITLSRGTTGTDTLQGTLTATASSGLATFNGLYYNKAETMTIKADAASADSSLNFTTEANYTQQDATSGTDFSSGTVILHGTSDANTQLLMHMDDTGLTDSSSAPHSITINGTDSRSNTQSKFGGYSAYQDGGGGNYLSAADSADWFFDAGDFTIDFWVYFTEIRNCGFIEQYANGSTFWRFCYTSSNSLLRFDWYPTAVGITRTWSPSINTWYHVAVVRNGNLFSLYVDGQKLGGTNDTITNAIPDFASGLSIGLEADFSGYLKGYMDELRVSKGIARWTANFTPPTSAYAISSYPTSQAYYVTTAAGSQINTSSWTGLSSAAVTQTTPTNTSIKYLVSFDGRTTWKYWNGSSWAASALASIATDGISKTTLEGITSGQWQSTGGFVPSTTTTLDFAASLASTDAGATPTLDLISVNHASYTSATSNNVVVSAGAIASYTVTSATPQTAGTGWSATVTAKDAGNNTVSTDSSTVVTMTNSGAALFYTDNTYTTTTTTYTLASGTVTIYVKDATAQTITLTATDANSKTGVSSNVVVNPGAIASYTVTSATPQTSGTGWSATVTAKDAGNNTVSTDSSTVVTMTNSGAALFYTDNTYTTTTTTYTLASGTATIYVKDNTVQTITITATDANTKTGTSSNVVVNAGAASKLGFTQQPSSTATAGVAFIQQPKVAVQDSLGNTIITDDSTSITLSRGATGTDTLQGANLTATVVDGVATFSGLSYNKAETMNIKAERASADSSVDFTTAGNYTQQDGTNGTAFASGAVALKSTGSGEQQVSYTITEATYYQNGTLTTTPPACLSDGIATFGQCCLTNTSTNSTLDWSYVFDLTTTKLVSKITPWMGYDTVQNWYLPKYVDVYSSPDSSNWTLVITHDVLATQGAQYINISLNVSTRYLKMVLRGPNWDSISRALSEVKIYEFPALTYPTSQAYYVTTAAGSQINTSSWTGLSSASLTQTTPANTSIKYLVSFDGRTTWKYWDGSSWTASTLGNIATNGISKTTLEGITRSQWQSSGGFVPTTTTTLDFAASLATTDANATPSLDLINVTYPNSGYTSATSTDVVVSAAAIDHYTVSSATPQTAGTGWSATVTAKDSLNNTVSSDSSTVVTMTNSGAALFYTDNTYTTTTTTYTLASGTATIYLKNTTAQTITITATDANIKTGVSSNVVVNPSPTIASYVVTSATPQTAGTGWSATVTAKDTYNNTVSTDSSTVVTMTNSGAALFYTDNNYNTTTTTYTLASGTATVYVRDATSQTITITATDANTKTGTSSNVVVNPSAIASYVITSATPQTAGTGWSATATAKDSVNNTVTTDSSTVVTMTNSGSALFYTDNTYTTTTTTYTLATGVATVYAKDTIAETITLTATDTAAKTGVSGSVVVNAGALITPSITPASLKAGATTNHTIAFTTANPIASGGKIEVDFNANYDLSGSLAYVSGNTGSTVAASNQTLTITTGTAISAAATPSIVISGIKNPVFLGTTGTYAVRTKDASSVLIDTGTASANTIVVPTMTLLTPSDTGITVYTGDSYPITWSSNGTVSDSLALYYATDGSTYSNTIATGETNDGTYSWTVPANPTTTAKVKIQDTFYQLLKDTTDTQFNLGAFSNTAVSGTGNGAGVVLIAGPIDPASLSTYSSYSANQLGWGDISVVGNYAYVGSYAYRLRILNISNPASPSLTYTYNGAAYASYIYASGNYAYLGYYLGDTQILDVSNPASPGVLGTISGNGRVYVSGNYAYKASGATGLTITNISNPASPVAAGTCDTSGSALDVYVSGNYAYVADDTVGLRVIDISNPNAPNLVGTYDTAGNAKRVCVSGNYAYVADNAPGLRVIDISNPTAPNLVGTCDTPGNALSVAVSGNRAYVGDSSAGLSIIDISTPTNPTSVGNYSSIATAAADAMRISGDYLYAADGTLYITKINSISSGTFTSRSIDTTANQSFGPLTWTATVPAQTGSNALRFQVAANNDNTTWNFVGPDNTGSTYFSTSGTSISSALNGLRYIKYKSYLATVDAAYTPTLSDVSIGFTDTNSANRVVSAESANNFTMSGAQITTANIQPASLVVGATGNVTVSFTTVNSLPSDGKIVITFPAGFTLSSGAATAVSGTPSGIDGTLTASVAGQVVTVTRSAGTASAVGVKSFILSNIKNPSSTGSTGAYSLKTTTAADLAIDETTAITADTITTGGSLTLTNVEPATRYAGVTENVTINFTTANPLPSDAKIVVTFPAGFTLSSGAATAVSSWNLTGTLSASVTGQVLTLTRSGATLQDAASTAVSIIVTNIQNPTP
ncbi:MAG: Ig-like domain-containing protein, partial [Candidatus Omnitrophota bacterium]|nr:Ig-like domain-containing protein [Candidatus Omnitrophota bacterium]